MIFIHSKTSAMPKRKLDKETEAVLRIRCDELCNDLRIDVMREISVLRASKIVLDAIFEEPPSTGDIIRYAIYLSNEEKKSAE